MWRVGDSEARSWRGGWGWGSEDAVCKKKKKKEFLNASESCKVLAGVHLKASWDSVSQLLIGLWFKNVPITVDWRHCWISGMSDIFIFFYFYPRQAHVPTLPSPLLNPQSQGTLSVAGMRSRESRCRLTHQNVWRWFLGFFYPFFQDLVWLSPTYSWKWWRLKYDGNRTSPRTHQHHPPTLHSENTQCSNTTLHLTTQQLTAQVSKKFECGRQQRIRRHHQLVYRVVFFFFFKWVLFVWIGEQPQQHTRPTYPNSEANQANHVLLQHVTIYSPHVLSIFPHCSGQKINL